jgi:hypothetical protein
MRKFYRFFFKIIRKAPKKLKIRANLFKKIQIFPKFSKSLLKLVLQKTYKPNLCQTPPDFAPFKTFLAKKTALTPLF